MHPAFRNAIVTGFYAAVLLVGMMCTPAERASVAKADALVIPFTKAACDFVESALPVAYVDLTCDILEDVEGAVPSSWADAGPVAATVRLRVPVGTARMLAARYPKIRAPAPEGG